MCPNEEDKKFRRVISDPKETAIDHSGRRRAVNAETGEPIDGPIGDTILTQEQATDYRTDIALEGARESRATDIAFEGDQTQQRISDVNFSGETADNSKQASELSFDADPQSVATDISLNGNLSDDGIDSHLRFREGGVSSSSGGTYGQSDSELRELRAEMQGLATDVRRTASEAARNANNINALHDATKMSDELASRLNNAKIEAASIKAETERLAQQRKTLK